MAINVLFGGSTIVRPGSYSRTEIDLGGGFPIGPVGLIGIIGEASRGKPGSSENISRNVYTGAQINEVVEKYGSGPIVDAMNFLFAPGSDGAIPGGANAVYVYKTNEATKAEVDVADDFGTVVSNEWGIGGNTIVLEMLETAEVAPVVTGADMVVGAADLGASFTVILNGVSQVVTLAADTYADAADVAAALVIAGATVTNNVEKLVITVDVDADAHKNGYAKSLVLVDSAPGDLALLGLVEMQALSSIESAVTIKVDQTRDLIVEEDTVGGNVVLLAAYTGVESAASISVSATQIVLTAGTTSVSFDKSAYNTLEQIANAMNLTADWSVSVSMNAYRNLPISVLDQVSAVGAKSSDAAIKTARIKKDADEVADFFEEASLVSIEDTKLVGLPDALAAVALAGGIRGATTNANINSGLLALEEIRVNSVIPLFSRDAGGDIVDNLTDAGSMYTIEAIHAGVKTHVNKMSTIKNRSERQGYISMKDTFVNCLDRSAGLSDARLQMLIQDTRSVDGAGSVRWFQPWAQACLLAGARAGSPIGTPLTFKFFNTLGVRHTAQPMSTPEDSIVIDFNPNTQFEQGINGGITFFEAPQSGGVRCVVDNTTYNRDANWVLNRGNVLYAADILAFDFRDQMERLIVGTKNTIQANEIKSLAASVLGTFLAQGITVATADAPNGYKSLSVRVEGNTVYIDMVVVLVEGIDFVLTNIKITRSQSAA